MHTKKGNSLMANYRRELVNRFWHYQSNFFKDQSLFDRPVVPNSIRPPVFRPEVAEENNILIKTDTTEEIKKELRSQIPRGKRHKWFRSMTSSQALAQSVFGNLKVFKKLDCLSEMKGDDGKPLFIRTPRNYEHFEMEYVVNYLGEPRPTNIDVFFGGEYRVAVECKLAEYEVGSCSRPKLTSKDPNYLNEYCDGRYVLQQRRLERCSLSAIGVKYWKYIPQLFNWSAHSDQIPCPLRHTYQLVRNILAACVRTDGVLDAMNGHAVLLYDARNPAFQPGGRAWNAWNKVHEALKNPALLQRCTWQQVLVALSCEPDLSWLVDQLKLKYGFNFLGETQ